MAHHRCTRCKQESYPRHKYQGGVYCDECIRIVRGSGYRVRVQSWLGYVWGKVTGFFGRVLHPGTRRIDMDIERASHARLKAMEARARDIPSDPQGGTPGKH